MNKSKSPIHMLSDNKIVIGDVGIICTEHCMEILLLAAVTVYEIGYVDHMCRCGFFCALRGFVNPFFNKRHRV